MTKLQLFHDASSPAKLEGFPSTHMSTTEADEVVVTRVAGACNPVVRCLQCAPSLLQCLFQLLQSLFRRSHRDTIPEQTNAVVRNSAGQQCTSDWKHGRVKQLFSTQTQIQSLSRMARCACMTMRNNQPCTSVSQDDNYQTSQECPPNKHYTLDLSRTQVNQNHTHQNHSPIPPKNTHTILPKTTPPSLPLSQRTPRSSSQKHPTPPPRNTPLPQAKRQMHTIHGWIVPFFVVSARTIHVVLGPTLRAKNQNQTSFGRFLHPFFLSLSPCFSLFSPFVVAFLFHVLFFSSSVFLSPSFLSILFVFLSMFSCCFFLHFPCFHFSPASVFLFILFFLFPQFSVTRFSVSFFVRGVT